MLGKNLNQCAWLQSILLIRMGSKTQMIHKICKCVESLQIGQTWQVGDKSGDRELCEASP